jgi:hypothetical protein
MPNTEPENPMLPTFQIEKGETEAYTFNCSLCSLATSIISDTYSPKPNCSNAFVMCSQAIVFLLSFSLISFASEEMRVMNSTQHSISRSRASFPNARPVLEGRISVTIFWTVARREVLACERGGSGEEIRGWRVDGS